MNKNTQQGFSMLEGLLIVIIVVMVGGVGWYVWNSNNKTNKLLQNASDTSTNAPVVTKKKSSSASSNSDPTTNWTAYSSMSGHYSLKYPNSWVAATNSSLCTPGLLLLGGNADSVGKCATEDLGQVDISSAAGDGTDLAGLQAKDGYKDITSQTVTVNNVKGNKQTATFTGLLDAPGGLPAGSTVVVYSFYTNGRTYTAEYSKTPSFPDVLSDFNLMITKTLQFHP